MSTLRDVPYNLMSSHIQQWFRCSFCHRLLVKPICTASGGDRYCFLCFEKILQNKQPVVYSANYCDELLSYDKIYRDVAIENDLKRFTDIFCHNKLDGCSWRGNYASYKDHIKVCIFEDLQCKYCLAFFTNPILYEEHYPICPKASISCSFNKFDCDTQIRRNGLRDHVEQNSLGRKEDTVAKLFFLNDEKYLWRIDNIRKLFWNAKIASEPIYVNLPSFYTSKYGYKLALKLYLNGDKNAWNTHLSLYVTIMRGDYDESLPWPFDYSIFLYLYDTSSKDAHIVHTLIPDIESKCYQQPRLDENESIKISEFCSLSMVFDKEYAYVDNDTMFIKTFLGTSINSPITGIHK